MWCIGNGRPSNGYITLFAMLFILSICITYYDENVLKLFNPKLQQTTAYKNKSLTPFSKDYLNVQLELSNTAICHLKDTLIIYILSTVTNFKRRKVLRTTWASPLSNICFVFILGKTEEYSSIQLRINNEKRQYKDIVQVDHIESYANVIYKEVAALRWSRHYYPSIPYLFKTDDDLIVDSLLISQIAQLLLRNSSQDAPYIAEHNPNLVQELISSDRASFFRGGWSMNGQPTLRAGKFGVSQSVWPHSNLPLYCSGFGWLMSSAVRNRLADASYTYPLKKVPWIGDVFLSGFLAKAANVSCTTILIDYEQTHSANCSCLMAQRPMLSVCSSTFHTGGGGTEIEKYKEYEKAWKVIRKRHGLVMGTISDFKVC